MGVSVKGMGMLSAAVGCILYCLLYGVISHRVHLVWETFTVFVWSLCSAMYKYS